MRVFTIGGYGFDESSFLAALREADVDLLVDIRQRAGMRGSKYAFLNKTRLQQSMQNLGKDYWHVRDLAPTTEIRDIQRTDDLSRGVVKRERVKLSEAFVDAYERQILETAFDIEKFCNALEDVESIAFFCVERHPEACHRSIVASRVAAYFGIEVKDLFPCDA